MHDIESKIFISSIVTIHNEKMEQLAQYHDEQARKATDSYDAEINRLAAKTLRTLIANGNVIVDRVLASTGV